MAAPLPTEKFETFATEVCEQVIGKADKYDHASVPTWNSDIINELLKLLIAATSPSDESSPPFKFVVSSTIIQHQVHPNETTGRRGMHSAVGAFWNNEKDGTWSFKWEGAEARGMDVVISVTWIGI
ncbi:putative dynein light chain [Amniculicola lignicola CBS 123094]|uniref:Putative dynein light chain n=1 Tax=Amniculicola lignicola CBS 123094 TaxID=1392246 RepID=A0A6A5WT93_9PLEO|nr:putative dynein light chain [Amniculicola lignicola CBS 123094]